MAMGEREIVCLCVKGGKVEGVRGLSFLHSPCKVLSRATGQLVALPESKWSGKEMERSREVGAVRLAGWP